MTTDVAWPPLPLEEWRDTCETLHMWTQIVGKIRLAQTPRLNHWWNVPLYVSPRGLTTTAMPSGERTFQIDFDFVDHRLLVTCSDGAVSTIPLVPRSVADFHRELMRTLERLGIRVTIRPVPVEVERPIPFEEDEVHASYDPVYAQRFWRILTRVDRVFTEFRAGFIGKCSPVHFFWGSFDLAVTRFSGRPAPVRPDADVITREAYSHEVVSHGFWPGSGAVPHPAFFSYTAPEPAGLSAAPVRPAAARYNDGMGMFIFLYDDMRRASDPRGALLEFLHSTYDAGADLAGWDRAALERR